MVRPYILTPEELGLHRAPVTALAGTNGSGNAAILSAIFSGEPGPKRDIVVLNAAAVLLTAGLAKDMQAGAALAASAIDSGAVTRLVSALRAVV